MTITMDYQGSCHCGRISYVVSGKLDEVFECNCSFCLRQGKLNWFVPRSALHLMSGDDDLVRYTFNTHKIQHYFCSTCACTVFGMGGLDGSDIVEINVRCLENVDISALPVSLYNGRAL